MRQFHIGFTGTQDGMTPQQKAALTAFLAAGSDRREATFHHGDCIGADAEADLIARTWACNIVIHPPAVDAKRAHCERAGGVVLAPRDYLERNRCIVDACQVLVAAPRTMEEKLRSGTWSTVRYARQRGTPIVMLWPQGGWSPEGSPHAP